MPVVTEGAIILRPASVTGPSGEEGHGCPLVMQFLMEFSAAEQKSSVLLNLNRAGEDDVAINP